MKKHLQEKYRHALDALMTRLRPEARDFVDRTRSPSTGQATAELSNAPLHLADAGTDEYLHELNATLMENAGELIDQVQAALERLDDGTYGTCEVCGKEIGAARLDALPFVKFCIHCAKEHDNREKANINVGRPTSPADTLADEEVMEITRRDDKDSLADMYSGPVIGGSGELPGSPRSPRARESDRHAMGTPGGGGPEGGLAGSTQGDGTPDVHELEQASGGSFERTEGDEHHLMPTTDVQGTVKQGTPVTKR